MTESIIQFISIHPIIIFILCIGWVMGMLGAIKADYILVGDKTDYCLFTLVVSFFIWPIIMGLVITTKHHVNNCNKDEWDY